MLHVEEVVDKLEYVGLKVSFSLVTSQTRFKIVSISRIPG
jgi:hypothetical protein